MKADIHPKYNPVVFVDGEYEIVTRSILTSKEVREIRFKHYKRCTCIWPCWIERS